MAGTTPGPRLSDGVTLLRRFTPADAPEFAAIHRDPLNVHWTGSVAAMDETLAREHIEGPIAAGWESGTGLRFAIVESIASLEQIVGTLSLQDVFPAAGAAPGSTGGVGSVGIKMLPAGRGTGSAQRAVELLCGYAFGNLGLDMLHWRCTVGNAGSISLAERCGFAYAARIPGFGHRGDRIADGLMYTQSAAQWARRDGSAGEPARELDTSPVVPVLRPASGSKDSAILLRGLTMADAPQLVKNCVDPEAVRWTTVPLNYTLDHAASYINTITVDGWRTGTTLTFAVADAATDALLGAVDLQCNNPGVAAVGINMGANARGTGAAEAAVRLLLDYAFNHLNLKYVHWNALVPNWASRKLAWKLGFTFDGHIRGDYSDRGTPSDRWVLSLAAGEEQSPRSPWAGPVPGNG